MMDLSSSSDEEDFITDTSQDVEFARWLFGDLNRDVLGPLDDGKVIIISDSNEEEEVHEESIANDDAAPSAAEKTLTLVASTADADEDPGKMQDDNSDDLAPERVMGKSNSGGDKAGSS
jgi:hypothetical protein